MVEIHFTGNHAGVVWYPANGRKYAFGNRDGSRTATVPTEDAELLIKEHKGVFKLAEKQDDAPKPTKKSKES